VVDARHRRAVAFISLALLALGTAAVVYLAPATKPDPEQARAAVPAPLTVPGETVSFTFLNPTTGWAAASMKGERRLSIFATADGAKSWRLTGSLDDAVNPGAVSRLRFFDLADGIVVIGPDELAFRTSDGGRSWAPIPLPATAAFVSFSDPLHGWATSPFSSGLPMRLFVTADAGERWDELPQLPVNGFPVFRTPREGWLAGPGGTHIVYTSPDGGQTWEPHYLPDSPCLGHKTDCPVGSGGPGNVDLLPRFGAVALEAWSGAEFVSYDLGGSWRYVVPPATSFSEYPDIAYEDSTHWWAIRADDLFKTADGGASWRLVSTGTSYSPMRPTILDARHAWVEVEVQDGSRLGERPSIGWQLDTTSDGGLSWHPVSVPVPG